MSEQERAVATPLGQMALHQLLDLQTPEPFVRSYAVTGSRRTSEKPTHIEEYYPLAQIGTSDTMLKHLRFALKREPLDLGVLYAALTTLDAADLEKWIRSQPTSSSCRRAWFFYEFLTGKTLDIESARVGNYVDALNSNLHYTGLSANSQRHRVRDNLLGGPEFCPTLRRTAKLQNAIAQNLSNEARELAERYDPATLARALNFLTTKETRSSFAIEGEVPGAQREERFLQALRSLRTFSPDKAGLLRLQNTIVDPRYAARNWRELQVYVGDTDRGHRNYIHYICPKPNDVEFLMKGWTKVDRYNLDGEFNGGEFDAVLATALISFGFVFIHPFDDGNGRIHRYLVQYALSLMNFVPEGLILPISAAIQRNMREYDNALEAYSKPVMRYIDYALDQDGSIEVRGSTRHLYRFIDLTVQAEYLYDRVADSIRIDLKNELEYLSIYDKAYHSIRDIVDMPNQRAALFLRLCLQNGGHLAKSKRRLFAELADDELSAMETAIVEARSQSEILEDA